MASEVNIPDKIQDIAHVCLNTSYSWISLLHKNLKDRKWEVQELNIELKGAYHLKRSILLDLDFRLATIFPSPCQI
jgi:hypothetical protein